MGNLAVGDLSRLVALVIQAPVDFLQELLVQGIVFSVGSVTVSLPPVSWVGVIVLFVSPALALKDFRLALLSASTFVYVAIMGLWQSTMMTLALVVVAVVIGVAAGLFVGIGLFRWRRLRPLVFSLLDFMQTVPAFGYLVPAILLFGYTPAAALIVTLIYSIPPMVRLTDTALKQVPVELVEFGTLIGCSARQLIAGVMLPSEKSSIMLGVNQVIMLTLNMVIISSLIGAGGLGYDVWEAVKSLKIGRGIEAGLAITLLAITLDRLSAAYAHRRKDHLSANEFFGRNWQVLAGTAIAVLLTILGTWFKPLADYNVVNVVSSGKWLDSAIDWINLYAYGTVSAVRDHLFIYVLKPTKSFMLSLPWWGVVLVLMALAYRLSGFRLALLCGAMITFIAIAGLWEKAMLSVYLLSIAFLICALAGVPLGFITASNPRLQRACEVALDTLQTLPSFVYLLPAVMLLGVGDFSALVAVVLYAIAPAIRYTARAVNDVPTTIIEAAKVYGATPRQIRRFVILPAAFPGIILGLNQTLMLAISMLIITAMVGTRDLGQETLIALSQSDPGRGLTAGICIAFIAIAADRLLQGWANQFDKGNRRHAE